MNRDYYEALSENDICHCLYCKNYVLKIKETYPKLDEYLKSINVDIEKPLETMPLDVSTDKVEYLGALYVVIGNKDLFKETQIDGVNIKITDNYPSVNVNRDFYIIMISPITLENCLDIK